MLAALQLSNVPSNPRAVFAMLNDDWLDYQQLLYNMYFFIFFSSLFIWQIYDCIVV